MLHHNYLYFCTNEATKIYRTNVEHKLQLENKKKKNFLSLNDMNEKPRIWWMRGSSYNVCGTKILHTYRLQWEKLILKLFASSSDETIVGRL